MTIQPAVLPAEDERHALQMLQGLKHAGVPNQVIRFRDGRDARDFLTGAVQLAFPMVLLLDISMPKLDGREALRLHRGQTVFRSMPIIMVTTTDDPEEMAHCRQLGGSAFMSKFRNCQEFALVPSNLVEHFFPGGIPALA
jgi:CheY-like chemotaxis protein